MELCYADKEKARIEAFESIWNQDINDVFSDVADYYDHANDYASMGLLKYLRRRFISTIDVQPGQKVLDVCAGTNVIGIELLKKQPQLEVVAADRSESMQEVGKKRAQRQGFEIESHICDVHKLPFPDNHFDVVTLQYATRHLRVIDVFSEINRVLKPGGHFYHCDMLRPGNKVVERGYYIYLKACLALITRAYRCGPASRKCEQYFIDAIRLFYSTDELSDLMKTLGFTNIEDNSLLGGTVGTHKACKA